MREYRTAQVAAIIGIHPNTVRFYEQWGLISKPERRQNGYRVFTDLHIRQIRLARTAFQIEVLQNGLRKKIIEMIKTAARQDFDRALLLTQEYIAQVEKERAQAEEAIEIARGILSGADPGGGLLMKGREAAAYLGVTRDALRNWERNGLLTVKRKENGYRVYDDEDIRRLKMIRSLRCANYSLEAILRLLRQVEKDPQADIRQALTIAEPDEDIISVCDKLLASLGAAEENAHTIMGMLEEMKALHKDG